MIPIELVAQALHQRSSISYSQCLVTVRRRARNRGYRGKVPRVVATAIVQGELRAVQAHQQSHEALLLI